MCVVVVALVSSLCHLFVSFKTSGLLALTQIAPSTHAPKNSFQRHDSHHLCSYSEVPFHNPISPLVTLITLATQVHPIPQCLLSHIQLPIPIHLPLPHQIRFLSTSSDFPPSILFIFIYPSPSQPYHLSLLLSLPSIRSRPRVIPPHVLTQPPVAGVPDAVRDSGATRCNV